MTDPRAITVADFSEAYDIPAWTVYKMIRQRRIRAMNFGTPRKPMYRIPMAECRRLESAAR